MLDTNICINVLNDRSPRVFMEMTRHDPEEICVSVATYMELMYGVENSRWPEKNRAVLERFLDGIEIIPLGPEVAQEYGRIRADLGKRGLPIGPMDLLIAAQASYLDLTLVTHNTREFARVASLELADWT